MKTFGYDLKLFLDSKIEDGHQLTVCGNFNSEHIILAEWMLDTGLQGLI